MEQRMGRWFKWHRLQPVAFPQINPLLRLRARTKTHRLKPAPHRGQTSVCAAQTRSVARAEDGALVQVVLLRPGAWLEQRMGRWFKWHRLQPVAFPQINPLLRLRARTKTHRLKPVPLKGETEACATKL